MADEAYVSGNLSSGGFPSLGGGDEKDAAIPGGPSLSAGSVAGGEGRKVGSKGREAMGKGLSQLPGRRTKNSPTSRRGVDGKGGSTPKTLGPSGSLPTPTTQLSRQIHEMGLASPLVTPERKRTLAERADDISPMSDADIHVGGGPSLDPGYVSMSQGPSSLEQPPASLSREKGRGGVDGTRTATLRDQKQDTHPRGRKSPGTYITHIMQSLGESCVKQARRRFNYMAKSPRDHCIRNDASTSCCFAV